MIELPKLKLIHNPNYVSFFPRVVAELIDDLSYMAWLPITLWYLAGSSLQTLFSDVLSAIALIVFPGVFMNLTRVYLIHHTGQTFGKMIVGIEVRNAKKELLTWKRAFFRESWGKLISGYIFGAGYLWVLFDRKHQSWHDYFVGSFVYEKYKNVMLGVVVLVVLAAGYAMAFSVIGKRFEAHLGREIRQIEKQQEAQQRLKM